MTPAKWVGQDRRKGESQKMEKCEIGRERREGKGEKNGDTWERKQCNTVNTQLYSH